MAGEKDWDRKYPDEKYQEVLSKAVHFTGKGINSNATAGIRLAKDEYLPDLPYVAVSTLPENLELLDYIGSASIARIFSQGMNAKLKSIDMLFAQLIPQAEEASNKKKSKKTLLSQEDTDAIKTNIQSVQKAIQQIDLRERYDHPENEAVNLRLRQIILQDQSGNDIAVTPLPSSGLSELLKRKIKQIDEKDLDKRHRFRQAHHNIGGGHTKNIGEWIDAMQELLWFQPPSENQELKKAYRYFHRGIKLDIPQALLKELYFWRKRLLKKHGVMPSEAKYKQEEKAIIQKMAQVILKRADEAIFLLQKYQAKVAKKASSLEPLQLGLINSSLRDSVWKEAFSRRLYLNIIDSRIQTEAGTMYFAIDESAGLRWQDYILEVFGA